MGCLQYQLPWSWGFTLLTTELESFLEVFFFFFKAGIYAIFINIANIGVILIFFLGITECQSRGGSNPSVCGSKVLQGWEGSGRTAWAEWMVSGIPNITCVSFSTSAGPPLQSEGDGRAWWGLWRSGDLRPTSSLPCENGLQGGRISQLPKSL